MSVDLAKLSPAALKAAMEGGTRSWGEWGSREHHRLYVEPATVERRRLTKCCCGCGKKATYKLMANGVCLGRGCEMSMRREVRASTGQPPAPTADTGR